MSTDIEIANSALAKIRGRFISSFDDNSTEAKLIRVLFPVIRDRLLRDIAPNFAKTTYELATLAETARYNYTNVFDLPSDVLKVLETDRYESDEWKQESGKIYANDTTFSVEVIVRVTDCEKFDSVFAEALAYQLAAELAQPLTGGTQIAAGMRDEAMKLIRAARTHSAQERGAIQTVEATSWLNARF